MSSQTLQTLPALTLWQPWGSMVALGVKWVETRSWPTNYRGWLVIHAAKRFTLEEREICLIWPFDEALKAAGVSMLADLPLGAGLCVARLDAVTPTEACVALDKVERSLGNYQPGRYGWVFGEIRSFDEPIPARGYQQMWTWPEPVAVEQLKKVTRLDVRVRLDVSSPTRLRLTPEASPTRWRPPSP